MPPAGTPEFFGGGNRAGEDGLVTQIAGKIIGERLGRGVASRGFFLEALQTDRLQVARDSGVHCPRCDWFTTDNQGQSLMHRLACKWRLSRQQKIEQRSE